LASCDLFCRVLAAAAQRGAAIPACPATDTIKEVEADVRVVRTLERARLRQVQTPQAFRRTWLEEAHRRARAEGFYGTDDASLVERLGRPVFVLPGEPWNGKITHPEDLVWAEAWCLRRQGMEFPLIEQRVGYGYDIHPFAPHRPLWLGGVRLADSGGLKGHSDADVVLHALCDALLGAAALGDLGHHFPPTDPAYRDISSRLLLEQTWAKVRAQGWHLSNADVMVLAERPRLAPFIPAMRRAIAEVLGCEEERISIKATTHEGLDAVGEGKGIAAHAVVHLWRTAAASERN
jgi:2-C-methyl-D-erythritol 2,4-cyclodiphosphate synthase